MRRPLVIYDFATAPFWFSSYMRKIWFSFLSVQRTHFLHPSVYVCHPWCLMKSSSGGSEPRYAGHTQSSGRTHYTGGMPNISSFMTPPPPPPGGGPQCTSLPSKRAMRLPIPLAILDVLLKGTVTDGKIYIKNFRKPFIYWWQWVLKTCCFDCQKDFLKDSSSV
jgi:hypothetical protein